jgi:hypothetical protein
MTDWNWIVLITMIGVSVGIFFNIRSLIRKWKANPRFWFDLLVGIVISLAALGGLVWIFIQQLP